MKRLLVLLSVLASPVASAAGVPSYLNYQGVLRDAADAPIGGTYDMIFGFYSAGVGGDEILLDRHTAAVGAPVTVSGGLFDVRLGSGDLVDGSGPGVYLSPTSVFRDYENVFLEITVGSEVLSPRVQIVAAAYALNAATLQGYPPASFLDNSANAQAKAGNLTANKGLAGYNFDTSTNAIGVFGQGANMGGQFLSPNGNSWTYAGLDSYGVQGWGEAVGGFFRDNTTNTSAYVSYLGRGIESTNATVFGAHFKLSGNATEAYLAYNGEGVRAVGTTRGGYFSQPGGANRVELAGTNLGIYAEGSAAAAQFSNPTTITSGFMATSDGHGVEGHGTYGVWATGGSGGGAGGYFEDTGSSGGGLAYVGVGQRGIWAKGTFAGGTFSHPNNVTFWADVSTPTYKIRGTGTVSFVQNHPYEKDKVIVYAAPEGDEVAVYTRGSGRLAGGVARVALGDTFRLVADPDVGLTAHLTPRGVPVPLSVESVTTSELVVRGPEGSDASFDYLVYGLRIGFEELAIVQPKLREAFLPAADAVDGPYEGHAELRAFNALERFDAMQQASGRASDGERRGARALAAAIDAGRDEALAAAAAESDGRSAGREDVAATAPGDVPASAPAASPAPPGSRGADAPAIPVAPVAPRGGATPAAGLALLPVTVPVEEGVVLALDPEAPGAVRPADASFDRGVAGCAVVPPDGTTVPPGSTAAGTAGVVPCRVDASYGPVEVGDLLTTSTHTGYAMRTGEEALGAILGKAMEPVASGTATIRVLVTLR